MRRRDIITLLGGAAAIFPGRAAGQQPLKFSHLAILTHIEPLDRTTGKRERYWTAFFDEFGRLGFEEGRWPGGADGAGSRA